MSPVPQAVKCLRQQTMHVEIGGDDWEFFFDTSVAEIKSNMIIQKMMSLVMIKMMIENRL